MKRTVISLLMLLFVSACAAPAPSARPGTRVDPTATLTPTSAPVVAPTRPTRPRLTASPTGTPTIQPTNPPTSQPITPPPTQPTSLPVNLPAIGDATPNPPPKSGSCGRYPCADDIDGWVKRIQVPPGFKISHVGRIPGDGHITSIVFGPDGRLYASTMEGAIYVFDASANPPIYTSGFYLPIGLAFRPGTSDLYVASRSLPADAVPNEGKVTIVRLDGSKQDIINRCKTNLQAGTLPIGRNRLLPSRFQVAVVFVRVMAKAIQLFQAQLDFLQSLTRLFEIFRFHLA